MLACCCAAGPTSSAEVVQTQAVLGGEDGPGLALPDLRETFGKQLERMKEELADDQSVLNEPRSRQFIREEHFPRWCPRTAEDSVDCQIGAGAPGIGHMKLPILCDVDKGNDASPAKMDAAHTREERLSAQVRTFARKAHKGIAVYLCDMESLLLSQCLLRIDETATTLTLQTALAREQEFSLKGLKSTLKGEAFKKRVPRLAHATKECLLLVFGEGSEESAHCLVFKDMSDRDEFHTSMKIIQVVASQYTM